MKSFDKMKNGAAPAAVASAARLAQDRPHSGALWRLLS
jgi:hypothetical protein